MMESNKNKEVLENAEKINEKVEIVPYLSLFRFATFSDKILIAIGTLGALCNGLTFPYFGLCIHI